MYKVFHNKSSNYKKYKNKEIVINEPYYMMRENKKYNCFHKVI